MLDRMEIKEPLKTAYQLIAGLSLFRLIYIFFLPITPQEAYYWYYIQYPALSYFDHPPMAAYSIGLGTTLFGDTVFGVKFMAVVWFLGINLLLLKSALLMAQLKNIPRRQAEKTGFWTVLFFNLTIFAHLYAILSVPDTPLLFFWILTLFLFLKFYQTQRARWLYLMGVTLGFGLISKYTMVALLPGLFAFLLFDKKLRRWLVTPHPYLTLVIMLLVFSPVIIWNAQNDWASFAFQFSNRAAKFKPLTSKYIVQLFFSQLFLLTPLVFGLLVYFVKKQVQTRFKDRLLNLLFWSGFVIIGGFIYVSLRSLVKMNWLLPGYLGWILGAVFILKAETIRSSRWIKSGMYFSVFLLLIAHIIQLVPNMPLGEGNTWSGWSDAAPKIHALQQKMGGRKKVFIFSNGYKSAALLKFYLPDHQDTYAENIYNRPALQFDIWGTPDSLIGKNALYVIDDRREYKDDLKYVRKYFDSVELIEQFEYKFLDRFHTRTIYCYEAKNYHGPAN
ncbi:ArnT family glycosyltransferase [Calditrichota bacterium GD2]